MWQNNVSWVEGLFSEIPFKRFQAIKTKSQWDAPLAIFTRVNPKEGNIWPNLRLEGIQSPTSPEIRRLDTVFSPDYYIVAIDTRLKRSECNISIRTRDYIAGEVRVTVEYQVSNLETLLSIEDPLASLKDRVEEEIRNIASSKEYSALGDIEMKNAIEMLDLQDETGITLKRFVNLTVDWPESITKILVNGVVDGIDDQAQRNLNKLKINKLNEFGITDPILIASVLSKKDTDFNVIMDHVRSISSGYNEQMERDLRLLNWLKDQDLLTRADVQNVVGSLTNRINDQSTLGSPIIKGLMSSAANDDQMLKNGDDRVEKLEGSKKERNEEQEGPKVIGKRKVDLPDKKEEK